MEWFSVATRLRLRVAILRQRPVALILAAGVALCPLACESRGPTSPSQPAPSGGSSTTDAQTGLVDGIVRDVSGPVTGALVEVTSAPGGSATTGADGVFSFKLPVGLTRLRSSKSGYYPRENDLIVRAGATVPLEISLERISGGQPVPQSPYTVRGLISNGRGAAVAGAEVWIYGQSSPIDNRYGTTSTDSGGRYSVSSPQRVPQSVRAMKDGHITRDVSILTAPDAQSTWAVDVVLVHIDRYTLVPVPPLTVGQSVRLEAQTDLDDGSSNRGLLYFQMTSSDPSVLQVPSTGLVQAVAPGSATVTAVYYGVTTTLQIRVER